MIHYGPMIRILHCCFSQAINSDLSSVELTSAQGHIIGYLAHHQQAPCQKDLEEAFHLSHPTVSGLLARLEKKDFVELRPDANDRRCKRIYLRPRGWECNDIIHSRMMENDTRIVQGFSEEEKQLFADFLSRAIQNMGGETYLPSEKEDTNQ